MCLVLTLRLARWSLSTKKEPKSAGRGIIRTNSLHITGAVWCSSPPASPGGYQASRRGPHGRWVGGITILFMNFTHFLVQTFAQDGSWSTCLSATTWSTCLSATTMVPLVPCCLYSKARETHPAPHATGCGGLYRYRTRKPIRGRLYPGGPTDPARCPRTASRRWQEASRRNSTDAILSP